MAGQPRLRELDVDIFVRGGMEWFLDEISDGKPLTKIAKQLSCSTRLMYDWIRWGDDEGERWAAFQTARQLSATALAEQGMEELANARSSDTAIVRERVAHKRWLAERYDRETFGQQKEAVQVNINLSQLHIDALKASPAVATTIPKLEVSPKALATPVEADAVPLVLTPPVLVM